MADYALALGLIALVGWLFVGSARRWVPGLARRPGLAVFCAALLAAGLVGAGVFQLAKSRTFQLAGELVSRVETQAAVVALTLDDGPTPGFTEELLNTLASHQAKATFYLTGAESDKHPELVKAIVAGGHELGNHSYSHPRLLFKSGRAVAQELERTDALLRASGYNGPLTFRPPGCKRLLTAPLYLKKTGRTTVTWDLEPDSIAKLAGDPQAMVDHVLRHVRPGSIVLLHGMYPRREPSREALHEILHRLPALGYRLVTVSELLALR